MAERAFWVYVLQCADGTLYTGSTVDLEKRVKAHNGSKNGAKYTRARRPVKLVYQEVCGSLADARAREAEIKRMTREEKLELVGGQNRR
jgi:putative endonuclease